MYFLKKRLGFAFFVIFMALSVNKTTHAGEITTLVDGLNGAYGSDYSITSNRAFFVERYAGKIHRINMNNNTHIVIGTGYNEPVDIKISVGGKYAYVVENGGGGTLVRVNLANANRINATVVSSNIGGAGVKHLMGQLALDEAHGYAYVIQNDSVGALWRVNLTTGDKVKLLEDFQKNPFGLLLTKDLHFAYYTELGGVEGKVKRLDLNTNSYEVVATGLYNPYYLAWADSGESAIYVAESGAGRVSLINLTEIPASVHPVVTGLPNINTRSVTVLSESRLLVCSHTIVSEVNLSEFDSSGPIFLGIGHVPVDRIFSGYADTTGDPGYFFQVKDAPFGGTLSLMINHERAYNNPLNARYYRIFVDGVVQYQSWSDYRWSVNRFVLETMNPDVSGYYTVRNPADIWYNCWLGYRLNTLGLSNGSHTITVRLYNLSKSAVGVPYRVGVKIDNGWPVAAIEEIIHDGEIAGACAIVDSGSDTFSFRITAYDNEGHLQSWGLAAYWGDNQSSGIDYDIYTPVPSRQWFGITSTVVPPKPWHVIERRCAHTFHLSVWDRAIDGYQYIHWSGYNKSITIMLP